MGWVVSLERKVVVTFDEIYKQTKEQLIDKVFDLAITGELKDWADTVEEGEDFYFSKELFESLNDKNVKKVISLIEFIELNFLK